MNDESKNDADDLVAVMLSVLVCSLGLVAVCGLVACAWRSFA